mmetsp:Transcript_20953/g.31949  ORF Transcript_20953/g.31949 Transcript_20953/m.31949 type:complete len:114 (+) Transcript_20953:783-1124(+)
MKESTSKESCIAAASAIASCGAPPMIVKNAAADVVSAPRRSKSGDGVLPFKAVLMLTLAVVHTEPLSRRCSWNAEKAKVWRMPEVSTQANIIEASANDFMLFLLFNIDYPTVN